MVHGALLDLLECDKNVGPRLAGYAAATLAGLTTLYYYWPLFAVQCLWAAIAESRRGPRLTLWLAIIAIAATPVLTLAVYQARPAPYLDYADGEALTGYLSFGFLFDPAIDRGAAERERVAGQALGMAVAGVLLLLAARGRKQFSPPQAESLPAPPLWPAAVLAGLATAAILAGIGPAAEAFPHKKPLLWLTAAFPALGFAGYCLMGRCLRLLGGLADRLAAPAGLVWLLAFGPVALVAAVHQYTPFYAPRGMALFSPFFIVLFGFGLASLARRGRLGAATAFGLALGLVPWHANSVAIAQTEPGFFEYQRLAEEVRQSLEPDEVILVSPHWSVTPLFYYWRDEADRLVGADWANAVAQRRRVWLVQSDGQTPAPELAQLLSDWTPVVHKSARRLRATLYQR